MGSNHSSEQSNGNSHQPTPLNSQADLTSGVASLNLNENPQPEGSNTPPSIAAAAAIAARHRLIEELHNIAQQRIIDEQVIDYTLNQQGDHLLHEDLLDRQNDSDSENSVPEAVIDWNLFESLINQQAGEDETVGNVRIHLESAEEPEEDEEESEDEMSLFRQVQNLLLSGRLRLTTSHSNRSIAARNMLSDHSTDEDEVQARRERCKRTNNTHCYMTIPDPKLNSTAHSSYKRLRHDVISRAGLIFDTPTRSSISSEGTSSSTTTEEAIPEEKLFQPSCSTFRSMIRNARMGLGPPRIGNGCVASPSRGFNTAIDKSQIIACRNRMTPNRRKIVDKNQTKTFCCHYIRDGEGLLTASQDQNIRIFEKKTVRQKYVKTCTIEVPYVGWSILDVAVSPDGKHVTYATWNNVLYQFDLTNEEGSWQDMPFEVDDSRFGIFSIKFNSSGSEIVAGTTSGLFIYNREADRCVMRVDGHEDDINAVCFANEDSNLVLSSGDDGLVKLWDRRTMGYEGDGEPAAVFAGHRDGITFIDSRGDDRYFLTNSKDQSIKVWDLRVHSSQDGINATKTAVRQQKWDYRWQYLPPAAIKTTNLPGDSSVMTIRGHSVLHTLIRARFSPDHTGKRFIYTGCARGSCMVFDLYTGELHKKYYTHKAVVRDAQWHPYENELVTSSWDGSVMVWRYDQRGPKTRNLDADTQIVQPYDSTDEWDEPVPRSMQEREKRARQRNAPSRNPAALWRGSQDSVANRQARIKYAETDPDPPTLSSSEEESYAAAAKRARRRSRRSANNN